jgi:hypothetical protein
LVEEVPALVEGDLELHQALPFGLARLAARFGLPELMLLVRKLVDPLDDLLVVRVGSRPRSGLNDTTVSPLRTTVVAAPPRAR